MSYMNCSVTYWTQFRSNYSRSFMEIRFPKFFLIMFFFSDNFTTMWTRLFMWRLFCGHIRILSDLSNFNRKKMCCICVIIIYFVKNIFVYFIFSNFEKFLLLLQVLKFVSCDKYRSDVLFWWLSLCAHHSLF